MRLEDSIWTDPRFIALGKLMGSGRFDAIGRVALLWSYCTEKQLYVLKSHTVDLLADFENFSALLLHENVDLAEQHDDGLRIRGLKGRIEWIKNLRKNAKKGGVARASQKATHKASQKGTQMPAKADPGSSVTITTTTPVTTLVPANKNIEEKNTGALAPVSNPPLPVPKKSKFSPETCEKMRAFIATYSSGYREKYGAPPEGIRDKALVGKLGHWIESVSEERACQLAQVYLQIDHKWINESCHDLWQFFRHLNRIGNALSTGQDPGGIDWKKVFGAA